MEAMGTSACRKKITASPPSPTKSGPPRTVAERSRISETAKGAGRKRRPEERKATAAALPAPGAAPPPHPGGNCARHRLARGVREQEPPPGALQQAHPAAGPGKNQRDRSGDRREEAGAGPPEARRPPGGKTPQREGPPIP